MNWLPVISIHQYAVISFLLHLICIENIVFRETRFPVILPRASMLNIFDEKIMHVVFSLRTKGISWGKSEGLMRLMKLHTDSNLFLFFSFWFYISQRRDEPSGAPPRSYASVCILTLCVLKRFVRSHRIVIVSLYLGSKVSLAAELKIFVGASYVRPYVHRLIFKPTESSVYTNFL